MSKKRIFLVVGILWMLIIYGLSSQPAKISSKLSGHVIWALNKTPILGDVFEKNLKYGSAQFIIRKSAHMFVYGVLAILCFFIIYEITKYATKSSIISMIITFIYACIDEFHQLFVPGRGGQITDVVIDCIGAIIGLVMINIVRIIWLKLFKVSYSKSN